MKSDRLIAIVLLMQQRGQVTAAEVADELEVSERTARRDLEALAMSGIPIYSQPGRGGGWRLLDGATTDLTGLRSPEVRALFLAAGPRLQGRVEDRSTLRKLLGALPEPFRDDAAAIADRVRIDGAGWSNPKEGDEPDALDDLIDATVAERQVRFDYAGPRSTRRSRVVHPLGLVTKRHVWYLVADTDRGVRTYRVDRIRSLVVLSDPVVVPEGFDLDEVWRGVLDAVAGQARQFSTRVIIDESMARHVAFVFRGRYRTIGPTSDDRIEAELTEHNAAALASQIAGFGNDVEFVDPPDELVAEMRRIAGELASRWN